MEQRSGQTDIFGALVEETLYRVHKSVHCGGHVFGDGRDIRFSIDTTWLYTHVHRGLRAGRAVQGGRAPAEADPTRPGTGLIAKCCMARFG